MKKIIGAIVIMLLVVVVINCKKENMATDYSKLMDSISAQKYYSSEILDQNHVTINGIWKVIGTSGGFSGHGYTPNFNYLIIKPNGIFGVVRNDSLVSSGKIIIKNQTDKELYVDLFADSDLENGVQIVVDSDKYLQLHNDTLELIAPCCDRFNTQFKRVN